jgi:hypothetical protein
MKSQAEIEELRNLLGAMMEMDDGPFEPEMRTAIAAVQNALCFILEDGSPHAAAFQRNWNRLLKWCQDKGILFIDLNVPQGPVQ